MSSKRNLVSVVIPVRNGERFIGKTLASALAQTHQVVSYTHLSQALYLNKGGDPSNVIMLPWDEQNEKTPEYVALKSVLTSGGRKAN